MADLSPFAQKLRTGIKREKIRAKDVGANLKTVEQRIGTIELTQFRSGVIFKEAMANYDPLTHWYKRGSTRMVPDDNVKTILTNCILYERSYEEHMAALDNGVCLN